jgi:hypothetical protein
MTEGPRLSWPSFVGVEKDVHQASRRPSSDAAGAAAAKKMCEVTPKDASWTVHSCGSTAVKG